MYPYLLHMYPTQDRRHFSRNSMNILFNVMVLPEGTLKAEISLVDEAVKHIHSRIPVLDDYITNYLTSILEENLEHFDSPEEINEAIGEVLEGVDPSMNKEIIEDICAYIYTLLGCTKGEPERKLLDAPKNLAIEMNKSCSITTNSFSMSTDVFQIRGTQNSEKQKKLDYEIKKKQAKLLEKEKIAIVKVSNLSMPEVGLSSVSQQVNKRDVAIDKAGGRTSDVHIENFDLSFGNKTLLINANLSLASGRRYGLVGRNGLGKTTLLRAISKRQLMIPTHLSVLHVEQEVSGDDTTALESTVLADEKRTKLANEIKSVQNQLAQEESGNDSLLQTMSRLYSEWQGIDGDGANARAAVILFGLGFSTEMQNWSTKQFSGGWRMRLSLARALFCRPDLLLLDEPTNMLDLKAIMWLEYYLVNNWPGTLLVVSHDRNFLNSVCTDMVHLIERRLDAYPGDYEAFTKARKERLRQQESAYEAQLMERQHVQAFIDRFRYNANRAALVQSKIKFLERMPKLEPVQKENKVIFRLHDVEKISPPILMLDEVDFHYDSTRPIFKRLDFNTTMESKIGLVGENGAGKTTLLKLLLGVLQPLQGERHCNGGLRLGYYHQHHVDQLDLSSTPLQILQNIYPNQPAQAYYDQLGSFGVSGELAVKPTVTLSGGQKARVQFAVMCFPKPNFLILDEPTNHLDMETISALSKVLITFQGGLVLVSHDERLLEVVCNEILLVSGSTVTRLENGMKEYRTRIELELAKERSGGANSK